VPGFARGCPLAAVGDHLAGVSEAFGAWAGGCDGIERGWTGGGVVGASRRFARDACTRGTCSMSQTTPPEPDLGDRAPPACPIPQIASRAAGLGERAGRGQRSGQQGHGRGDPHDHDPRPPTHDPCSRRRHPFRCLLPHSAPPFGLRSYRPVIATRTRPTTQMTHSARRSASRAPSPDGRHRGRNHHLSVQRDLLAGRGERPGDLEPALLAKHEPHLARGSQPVGVLWAKRRAGSRLGDRAEKIFTEEATVATWFPCCHSPVRHTYRQSRSVSKLKLMQGPSKRIPPPGTEPISGNRRNFRAA
jgi:hypothetical protein